MTTKQQHNRNKTSSNAATVELMSLTDGSKATMPANTAIVLSRPNILAPVPLRDKAAMRERTGQVHRSIERWAMDDNRSMVELYTGIDGLELVETFAQRVNGDHYIYTVFQVVCGVVVDKDGNVKIDGRGYEQTFKRYYLATTNSRGEVIALKGMDRPYTNKRELVAGVKGMGAIGRVLSVAFNASKQTWGTVVDSQPVGIVYDSYLEEQERIAAELAAKEADEHDDGNPI